MMAHVIGYTGEISEQELDLPEFAKYDPGPLIGKFGIERQYNDSLAGVDGQRQVVVDNRGQVRAVLKTKPATPGKDLQLTIDLDLQAVAELAMDGTQRRRGGARSAHRRGARHGQPARVRSQQIRRAHQGADWKDISDNPDHPMLNRAIQAQLPPGSTFKPFMALAGLETGAIDDKFTVALPRRRDALRPLLTNAGHSQGPRTIALHNGIVHSCDVFFYTVGEQAGIDNLAFYGDLVGFGHKTGIDLPNENEGIMPSPEWKLRNYREKW